MSWKSVEDKKKKLEKAREKVLLQERAIKELETRKRAKNFSEIGRIAFKADIDQLDKDVLLGAFLEISDKLTLNNFLEGWKEKAKTFIDSSSQKDQIGYSVVFSTEIDIEVKQIMKNFGFTWNRIRKEFSGYSNLKTLESELNKYSATITEIV